MTHSLLGVQKHLRGNCAFCGNLPYNDKCQNVIDVSIRKKILRNKKRCFTCLMTGHIKCCELKILQLSRKKSPHFDCENTTNIDDKKYSIGSNEVNEEIVAMFIDAKTDLLLQTADYIIFNPRETKTF